MYMSNRVYQNNNNNIIHLALLIKLMPKLSGAFLKNPEDLLISTNNTLYSQAIGKCIETWFNIFQYVSL